MHFSHFGEDLETTTHAQKLVSCLQISLVSPLYFQEGES